MTDDSGAPSARNEILAAIRLHWLQWRRSRAPIGLLLFVVAICAFDAIAARRTGRASPWHTPFVFLAAWTGMLAGFDSYTRLRGDGSLPLLLRRAVPRPVFAFALLLSAGAVSLAATMLALLYLLLSGRAPLSLAVAGAVPKVMLAILAFVALAQLLALLLPRDLAAIAGMLVIAFGASPYDHWLPAGSPAAIAGAVHVAWSSLPTSVRLYALVGGAGAPAWHVTVMSLQLVAAFIVVCVLLSRPATPTVRRAR